MRQHAVTHPGNETRADHEDMKFITIGSTAAAAVAIVIITIIIVVITCSCAIVTNKR